VSVSFVDRATGRPLRYGGINPDGEPLHDSDGNPVYTLEGRALKFALIFWYGIYRCRAAYSPIITLPSHGGKMTSSPPSLART